jgi:hypothetical protein
MFLAAVSLNWEPLNFCVKTNGMSCTCLRNFIMCTEIGELESRYTCGNTYEDLLCSVCFQSPCLRVSPRLLLVSSPTCNPSSCPASLWAKHGTDKLTIGVSHSAFRPHTPAHLSLLIVVSCVFMICFLFLHSIFQCLWTAFWALANIMTGSSHCFQNCDWN